MKETENRTQVTLEDLLHLKRAERPPAEFWPEFDRQLRGKQLAAIVEERPRWRSWMRTRTFSRVCLPIGATAALALTIGSVRTSFRSSGPQISETAVAAATDTASTLPVATADTESNKNASRGDLEQDVVAQTAAVTSVASDKTNQTVDTQPGGEVKRALALSDLSMQAHPAAAMLVPHLGLPNLPAAALVKIEPATAVEPLTQISTPRDNRRARLLAYSVSLDPHAPDSSDASRSRERITRRLSDEALYDSISRLGLTGESVSIKF